MHEVYSYIDFRNQKHSNFSGLKRIDKRDYPEVAIREALLNLIVHREYSYSASSFVRMYTDRIEFTSIGGLLKGITLEDIQLGISVCRNPKLANIFYRLELIEAYGTGIQKILDLVSFDDVQFDGEATGHINISSALGTPRVNASVNVDDFIFNHALMGFLNLSSHWNNKSQIIDIAALIRDNAYSTTINGYLSPSEDYIDLNFGANGTNALFLNDFFPDAMQLSEGRTSGRLRLFGDLHAMNLEGTQIVSGLKLGIEPLGTKYEIKSDTVQFTNNLISFPSFKLYDTYGNYSNMTGSVKHRD